METTINISESPKYDRYTLDKAEIHNYIKDNLEHWRKKMLEHKEEQKQYIQSKWEVAKCGYCFKRKYNKSLLMIIKGEWKGIDSIFEIVCSTCLFKNKIWK